MSARLGAGIALAAWLLMPAAAATPHCVVLQYHHFSDSTPAVTSVTPAQFDAHLDYLATHNFQVLPLQQVVDALHSGTPLPDRCAAISVDDAYISVYQNAFPRLRARGWPFTVFVSTQGVDEEIAAYMSWQQMREMAGAGVTFENHGHSHDHLVRRRAGESEADWRQRVRADIETAQQRIGSELGRQPALFAYPYGEYDLDLAGIVGETGLVGFGQQSGPIGALDPRTALPRFPMAARYAELPGFIDKINSLPMPLRTIDPVDPLLPLDQWRPLLRLRFAPGSYRPEAVRCWVNGSDQVDLRWPAEQPDTLEVQSRQNLPVGRSRYNCTMPASGQAGRFHWISQPWIRRQADGGWYAEP